MQRINETLLSRAERRLLDWACRRMPARVSSDMLTALGVAGAGLCFAGYVLAGAWLWLAVAGMALNWVGDSLDGSLARFRRAERARTGAKRLKRGAEIPIAVLVSRVALQRRFDLRSAVRPALPRLASAIRQAMSQR